MGSDYACSIGIPTAQDCVDFHRGATWANVKNSSRRHPLGFVVHHMVGDMSTWAGKQVIAELTDGAKEVFRGDGRPFAITISKEE